jgi:phospholipase/lecithinase/hemolysin
MPLQPRKLINMAYGGGLINQTGFQDAPVSLMAQINDYLLTQGFDLGSTADTTQYIFQGGPNDIWFAPMNNETMTASGPTGRLAELPTAIPFMVTWQISKLIQAGAKNILIILLPPLHRVPESVAQLSPAELIAFSQFVQQINAGIRAGLASINSTAVSLKVFDAYAFTEGLISNPLKYGLTIVNQPCFANYNAFLRGKGGVPPVVCQHPERYLFWDGAGHPTTTVHNLVGLQVRGLIGL